MLTRRIVLGGLLAITATPSWAQQVKLISPQDVHAKRQAGEIALVDVRTPGEWMDGGVAEGAELIAMQDPKIGAKLAALAGGDINAPIALICRTGARSGHVAKLLAQAGYTNVYSVNGGMIGSASGPGWKRIGLPVSKTKTAASGAVEVCADC